MASPALLRYDPEAAGRLPHRSLVPEPTPVERLERFLGDDPPVELWVKRDDLTNPRYGGNKPRKLEFLLADALQRGSDRLITFGVVGSHHALATALMGAEHGLQTTSLLVNGPLHPHAVENVRRTVLASDEVLYLDALHAPIVAARLAARYLAGGRRPYLIPPGGSSPVGNLGYVSAALELAEQIEAGAAPRPDYVFVPAGSMGTMTGLILGLALAGVDAQVIGVDVVGRPWCTHAKAWRTTKKLWTFLRERSARARKHRGELSRFTLLTTYRGKGYGFETPAGRDARDRMLETEGLTLDRTYTAKTVAAIQDFAARGFNRGKTVLYWHTLSSAPMPDERALPPISALPSPLDRLARNVG